MQYVLNDKRLLKVDAEKIRNLLWGSSNLISEGDKASSKKDLLKPKIQPDIISGGVASLILKVSKFMNKWWAVLDSNQRPPQCQCDALPSAPTALKKFIQI